MLSNIEQHLQTITWRNFLFSLVDVMFLFYKYLLLNTGTLHPAASSSGAHNTTKMWICWTKSGEEPPSFPRAGAPHLWRKKFFLVRVVRHCNRLPKEIVVSLSWSCSRPSWIELWVTWSSDMFLYKAIHPFHQLRIKCFYFRCKRAMRFLCMRECIKFYLVLWWRLCKWVFLSSWKII